MVSAPNSLPDSREDDEAHRISGGERFRGFRGGPKDLLIRTQQERRNQNVWDKLYAEQGIIHPEPYAYFSHVLRSFRDRGHHTVVDAACGASARHIKPLMAQGHEVLGFDLSQRALHLTKAQLMREGMKVPELVVADMFEPWPFQGVDAVVMIQALYHGYLPEIERTVRHIHEDVLNEGGSFIFTTTTDLFRSIRGVDVENYEFEDLFDIPEKGTFVPKVGREVGLPHHIFEPNEIFSMLEGMFPHIYIYEDRQNDYLVVDARRNGQ